MLQGRQPLCAVRRRVRSQERTARELCTPWLARCCIISLDAEAGALHVLAHFCEKAKAFARLCSRLQPLGGNVFGCLLLGSLPEANASRAVSSGPVVPCVPLQVSSHLWQHQVFQPDVSLYSDWPDACIFEALWLRLQMQPVRESEESEHISVPALPREKLQHRGSRSRIPRFNFPSLLTPWRTFQDAAMPLPRHKARSLCG